MKAPADYISAVCCAVLMTVITIYSIIKYYKHVRKGIIQPIISFLTAVAVDMIVAIGCIQKPTPKIPVAISISVSILLIIGMILVFAYTNRSRTTHSFSKLCIIANCIFIGGILFVLHWQTEASVINRCLFLMNEIIEN